MHRLLSGLLVILLLLVSCSRASDDPDTTNSTDGTSTNGPGTADDGGNPTTTSTTPPPDVSITGLPDELAEAVTNLYLVAAGFGDPSDVAVELRDLVDEPPTDVVATAEAHLGTVLETEVAVIVLSTDDIVLAVDEGSGWRVVGAHLQSWNSEAVFGAEVRQIMVIGSDARPGQKVEGYRADSLHIVAAVPGEGAGAIVGIPRDSYVEAPDGRNRKFTNIMAGTGPDAILETARNLTDLEIEGYLLTGFAGFVDLIDEFGAFEIDIPINMADSASGAYFRAGVQTIDGGDALAFARNRTIAGGDFTRQLHGGVIIGAIAAAVQGMGVDELPALLEMLTRHVQTDLSAEQLLTLTASLYVLDLAEVDNVVVPGSVGTAGGASVVFLDEEADLIFADLADGSLEVDEPEES